MDHETLFQLVIVALAILIYVWNGLQLVNILTTINLIDQHHKLYIITAIFVFLFWPITFVVGLLFAPWLFYKRFIRNKK
jgi:hypothetical protein